MKKLTTALAASFTLALGASAYAQDSATDTRIDNLCAQLFNTKMDAQIGLNATSGCSWHELSCQVLHAQFQQLLKNATRLYDQLDCDERVRVVFPSRDPLTLEEMGTLNAQMNSLNTQMAAPNTLAP